MRLKSAEAGWRAFPRFVSTVLLAVIGAGAGQGVTDRPRMVPVRLHAAAGWGVPAVDQLVVYYLTKHHELIAVDRRSGAEKWRQILYPSAGVTRGSQVRRADRLVVAGDEGLIAVEAETGRRVWQFGFVADAPAAAGRFIGAVTAGVLVTGSASGDVSAVDVETGRLLWRDRVGSEQATVFAEAGDEVAGSPGVVVVASTDSGAPPAPAVVLALDVRDGSRHWSWPIPQEDTGPVRAGGPPARAGTLVLVPATDGAVYALERASGALRWRVPPASAPSLATRIVDIRTVSATQDRAVITSLTGVLTGVDLSTGATRWQFTSPENGSNGFGVSLGPGRVFAPFASGRMAVVDLVTGHRIAMLREPAPRFDWPPAIAGGQAFVAAEDGLYELRSEE